jgi:hypothetical protein
MEEKNEQPNGSSASTGESKKQKPANSNDELPPSRPLLTPHTLRLLKLIEDGTTDHARMAAIHLNGLTAKCSPLILWEILGRLQAFLVSKEWNTRSNAGLAMEGVAKHLPVEDQEAFLSQDHRYYPGRRENKNDNSSNGNNDDGLTSLTIYDLEGNLSTVLEKGRLLVATAESRYQNTEDDELEYLNQSCQGFKNFCEMRLEMQRRILTRRLGLSNILAHYTTDCDQLKTQLIGEEEIERLPSSSDSLPRNETGVSIFSSKDVPTTKCERNYNALNSMRPKKRQKRQHKNSNQTRLSIGALLTMEIQRQEQHKNSPHKVSHRTAQALLAGELLFRIFDPSWHVRHGSLIGILALIRAWKAHRRKHEDVLFGVWPHDILARALCVLALDRFGDYSGASAEAVAGGMVAPVLEMAGQVFAVVFIMSPHSLKQKVRNLLNELLEHHEWETRHGALLAIKYTVVLTAKTNEFDEDYYHREGNFIDFFADQVISRLGDPNDDVQGVASQILTFSLQFIDFNQGQDSGFIPRIVRSLWKSLENVRVVSSSINDLVKLLSKLIRRNVTEVLEVISNSNSSLHGLVRIFSRTSELLDCELLSVKICILHVIGSLSNELIQFLDEQMQPSTISETDKAKARSCFCAVVKDVYSLCCATSLAVRDTIDENDNGNSDLQILNQSCSATWAILSETSNSVFRDSISIYSELTFDLLTKYFDLRSVPKVTSGLSVRARMDHATTIARFLCPRKKYAEVTRFEICKRRHDILEFHLLSYLDSPFIFHFEAACFLIQTIFNINDQKLFPDAKVYPMRMLELCKARLVDKLQIHVTSQFHKKSNPITHECKTLKTITDSFYIGYTMVCKQNYSGKAAAVTIIDLWKEARLFPNNDSVIQVTVDSMRLTDHIVGTLVAGGINCLPKKLTPIIRPLMTSIQNEVDGECQMLACSYMESFLLAIIDEPVTSERYGGLRKTYLKVLSNLCRLVMQDKKPSCVAASTAIGLLVSNLRQENTLHDLPPVWDSLLPLLESSMAWNIAEKTNALHMMKAVCRFLDQNNSIIVNIFDDFMLSLVNLGCSGHLSLRNMSSNIIQGMCLIQPSLVLDKVLPNLILFLQDDKNDNLRSGACMLLRDVLDSTKDSTTVCPYVKVLLPIVMSMMIDPVKVCAEISASIFSMLVRVAPLVKESADFAGSQTNEEANLVIDHLIHGEKLLPCEIHPRVAEALREGNIILRNYQREGVSWLRFLQRINLNGALCDSMGLGKTLQAILGVSLAHMDCADCETEAKSLVVCPSSIVGHWVNEIERYFPRNSIFRALAFVGNSQQRSVLLKNKLATCNLVVTSYEILRSEIRSLSKVDWTYCILDEGHLLRNPKTATARASRRLRARHKLILTGTPIQNSVNEIWATFDFLMPNFLGSSSQFSKEFSKPIIKGQNLDARAADIAIGMEKLKLLHQQVLPFILRREKEQVLKELPPKIITRIPCPMSSLQEDLYQRFCSNLQGKRSIATLDEIVDSSSAFNPEVLKSLLYLRLLCTHPSLVRANKESKDVPAQDNLYNLEASGKLIALKELLRDAGMNVQDLTAADNDSSLLYCDREEEQGSDIDDHEKVLEPDCYGSSKNENRQHLSNLYESRCLIFAQFTHSLDVVEELLIKRHMPSVKYLRLDGKVPVSKRSAVVDRFNQDDSFKIMLLTTKVGGLGLNLTGADTVIFLEHDWNPHSDLQAMDRAHRIGQKRTVHVYQLVTMNSIEEKTMLIQERKLAMSKAIVNTDNSSMYSMGTDRLLDIFQFRTESSTSSSKTRRSASEFDNTLDSLVDRYQDEYQSLSLNDFLAGFESK